LIGSITFLAYQALFATLQPAFSASTTTVDEGGKIIGSCVDQSCVCKGYQVKNYDNSGKEWGSKELKTLEEAEEWIQWALKQHETSELPWSHPSKPMCIVDASAATQSAHDKMQARAALRPWPI